MANKGKRKAWGANDYENNEKHCIYPEENKILTNWYRGYIIQMTQKIPEQTERRMKMTKQRQRKVTHDTLKIFTLWGAQNYHKCGWHWWYKVKVQVRACQTLICSAKLAKSEGLTDSDLDFHFFPIFCKLRHSSLLDGTSSILFWAGPV